jgi:ABC-type tungstate transport system substrate-binding protein
MNKHFRKQIIGRYLSIVPFLFALMLTACENTNRQLATEAGTGRTAPTVRGCR